MQVGDRILSVNGCKSTSFAPLFQQPLHDFLGPEVKNACIKVEFDITDFVVPTSGEFTVKLVKNDYNRSLGITITGNSFLLINILVGYLFYFYLRYFQTLILEAHFTRLIHKT